MIITKENIFDCINKLVSEIDEVIAVTSEIKILKCKNIVENYRKICSSILSFEDVSDDLYAFIISDEGAQDVVLPEEYKSLKKICEFYVFVRNYFENKIKQAVLDNNIDDIYSYLVSAIQVDIKNIELIDYIAHYYIEQELYNELIEIYKLIFVYSLNPMYFEKIGDIYYQIEDYESALDSYLNCAESSEETVEIYKKLADVFGKINDNESRLACLEHIKMIESNNV